VPGLVCCLFLGSGLVVLLGAWCTACFARLRLWSGATTATRMMMMMIPLLGTVIQLSVHTLSAYSAYIIHHSPFTTATPHASHNSSAGHPGDRRIRARPSIAASHLNSLPPASPASPLVPHHSTCLSNSRPPFHLVQPPAPLTNPNPRATWCQSPMPLPDSVGNVLDSCLAAIASSTPHPRPLPPAAALCRLPILQLTLR
jgi:hypothetical protein